MKTTDLRSKFSTRFINERPGISTVYAGMFTFMSGYICKRINVRFGDFSQNDVQEFITFMINTLHNALCNQVIVKISGEIKNDLDKLALEAMKSWKQFFKDDYLPNINPNYLSD